LQIEILVNILKTYGLCLTLAMLVAVLELLPLPTVAQLSLITHSWVQKSADRILFLPSLIAYYEIESVVLLVVEPSSVLGHWVIEVSSPTPEDLI
jgi:D-alanyl-lipoteichoic acid acyltransferase DltB (MBOAT superfamily)